MGRDSDRQLPTVRYLDAERDVYGVEMLRRLLKEIRTGSPLLRSLRDEVLNGDMDEEDWLKSKGISTGSALANILHQTRDFWRMHPKEAESPMPYWPHVEVPLEDITISAGWDRTRERWEDFERRYWRQGKAAMREFLKQYKAEVMGQTERIRRYDGTAIRWLVLKAWGFDERGRPWSWRMIAVKAQRSIPTVRRAVNRLSDFYAIGLVRRSRGGRPPGPSSTLPVNR